MKLVRLVGFITKKFVTMHGHMDVKFVLERLTYTVCTLKFCYNSTMKKGMLHKYLLELGRAVT